MVGQCYKVGDDFDTVKYTYASPATAWTPINVSGLGVLIPQASFGASVEGGYFKKGVFAFPITSGVTLAVGGRVYLDTAAGTVQTAKPTAGFQIGTVMVGGTGNAGGTVFANVAINQYEDADDAFITVYGSNGVFKATYSTINLAVAALANDDILKIGNGSFTLSAACDITKTGVKIIGSDSTTIVGAAGADYCFKTVFGAITSTKEITIKNISFDHGDDATQQGIVIDNASATGRINAYLENVSGESDGGDSIHVTHTATAAAIRLYVTGGTFEGPVNFTVKNTDDRIRFEGSTLRGGLVTSTDNVAMEIELWNCKVLHEGVTGGHASQLAYAMYCLSETDANPNVYAALDTSDLAGSHTESVLFPAS